MRIIHTLKVLVRAEKHGAIVMGDVGFQTLEALNGVVKSGVSGIKLEGLVCLNQGSLPSPIVNIIVYLKHVVSRKSSKGVLMVCSWLGLEVWSLLES